MATNYGRGRSSLPKVHIKHPNAGTYCGRWGDSVTADFAERMGDRLCAQCKRMAANAAASCECSCRSIPHEADEIGSHHSDQCRKFAR